MLVEIQSNAFKGKGMQNGKITFHKGLNAIVATEPVNNSTGKSSILLAIDFAFGGNSYAQAEAKIIDNVGNHTVNFAFEFSGERFYFRRPTSNVNKVQVCRNDYSIIKEISLKEYLGMLAEKYDLEDKTLTFRACISPYFRISHKSSKNLRDFLAGSPKSSQRNDVVNFEKLFNRFVVIAGEKEKADDTEEAVKTFKEARKRNFLSSDIMKETDLTEAMKKNRRIKKRSFRVKRAKL